MIHFLSLIMRPSYQIAYKTASFLNAFHHNPCFPLRPPRILRALCVNPLSFGTWHMQNTSSAEKFALQCKRFTHEGMSPANMTFRRDAEGCVSSNTCGGVQRPRPTNKAFLESLKSDADERGTLAAGYGDPALQVADSGRDCGVRDVAYPVYRYVSIYQVPSHFAFFTKHLALST